MGGSSVVAYTGLSTGNLPYRFSPSQAVEYGASRYVFYINSSSDLVYKKSTNRGKSWSSPVNIHVSTVARCAIWFDRWTPGDTGTVVHIWDIDDVSDDVAYFSLDISTDTLGNGGTPITVFAGATTSTSTTQLTGAKARGGNLLCVFNLDGGTEIGSYRSTDAGATWGARADANEVAEDFYLLFPGNEADSQDMWLVYWDTSANEISLKVYDDSADSWGETSISGSMTEVSQTTAYSQMAGSIRASDNHLLLVAWNAYDSATGDLNTWDINGAASITAKTDVVTNSDDCILAHLAVAPNGTVHCTYAGKSDGSQTAKTALGIYRKSSNDGMATWTAEYTVNADYIDAVCALTGAQQSEGSFPLICWSNDTLGGSSAGLLSAAYQTAAPRVASMIGV